MASYDETYWRMILPDSSLIMFEGCTRCGIVVRNFSKKINEKYALKQFLDASRCTQISAQLGLMGPI